MTNQPGMRTLATVLLHHQTAKGSHYDWLMEDPPTADDPASRLWTARVELPSRQWMETEAWLLEEIAPHRRLYLIYEGPLSEGRGDVRRIDEGSIIPRVWAADRRVLEVRMRDFHGALELRRSDAQWWEARHVR